MNNLTSDEEVGYEDVNVCDASDELIFKEYKSKIQTELTKGKIFKEEELYGATELNYKNGKNLIIFFTGKERPVCHVVPKKYFYEQMV